MDYGQLGEDAMAAWARVSIHVGYGRVEDAEREALDASGRSGDWSAFGGYLRLAGPRIFATEHLPLGWCWVEPQGDRILLARSAVTEFGGRSSLSRYARTVPRLMQAPGFRRYSVEDWRLLRPVARD